MRFQEKIRIILKYVSGLLAAIAVIGLIGTTGSDFLGNISYMQMVLQLIIWGKKPLTASTLPNVLWRQVWRFIGLSNRFDYR